MYNYTKMGASTSREIIQSYDRRIDELEKRILELEQRVFLGATKDRNGNLIFDKDIVQRYDPTRSSVDSDADTIYSNFINVNNR